MNTRMSTPAKKSASKKAAKPTKVVETAVAPIGETPETPNADTTVDASTPADASAQPEAAAGPNLAADGMSAKMPEGHTVHFEKPVAAVDPNVRSTAAGVILTSADDQRKIEEA